MNNRLPVPEDCAESPESPNSQDGGSILSSLRLHADVLGLILQLNRLARHCALDNEVIASAPRPIEVFSTPMSRVAKKAQALAKAVAGERVDFESHYRDNRKRLIACAWELAHLIENDNEGIAYEFACACLRANRTKTADDVLERLATSENTGSKYVVSARRRFARLAWKAGNAEKAIEALRSVRGRAARNQYRTWLGVSTVRNGLLLAESGDAASARAVLTGGLLASSLDRTIAEKIAAIYLKAACGTLAEPSIASAPHEKRADMPSGQPTPIILSGFGWSGSGAVADFLKGHPRVVDTFQGREVGIWTGKYGLDRLYAHFASKGFNRRLLLEFLTRHCFGHRFLGPSKGTKSLGGIWAWLDESQRWVLLEALASWLDAVQEWQQGRPRSLLEAFQSLASRFLQLLVAGQESCVLLSNCIPSDAIVGIRMFYKPVVIVSWRNPADAYASKMAAFPDNRLQLNEWKDQLTTRIDKYLAGKAEVAKFARLWMDLSFEEFVQNERLRQQLLVTLNLDGQPMETTFDPTISARNIGILDSSVGNNKSAWRDFSNMVARARNEAQAISTEPSEMMQEASTRWRR